MARTAGTKNRNYPPLTLADGLRVPRVIQDGASGMAVSRLTLAELLGLSPSSSNFKELVASSRLYGLTSGGINSDEFALTELGDEATGADEVAQLPALKRAVLNISPYKTFFEKFKNRKVPTATPFKEFLTTQAEVPSDKSEECMQYILADATTAGFLRTMKNGDWIDLEGTSASGTGEDEEEEPPDPEGADSPDEETAKGHGGKNERKEDGTGVHSPRSARTGKKVFIAHGTNRVPLEQLKKALDTFKVPYAIAVDEPNKGRPISKKVAQLMEEECSSGIFIFTADERFLREVEGGEPEEVWRPRENVVYELGAASILYENRIVIFKENGVSFPSDFSDLGYIKFEKDQLATEIGALFQELVALDILEVRAKG